MIIQWHDDFSSTSIGGGPVHVNNIISNISNIDHIVLTDAKAGHPSKQKIKKNAHIFRLPTKPIVSNPKFLEAKIKFYPLQFFYELQIIRSKYKFLKETPFDLLHFHGIIFYTLLRNINRWTKLKMYQKIVDYSFLDKPKLLTLHNFFPGSTKDQTIIDLYNHYIDQFENIICVDKHIYEYCTDYCKYKDSEKSIWFVPNSVDMDKFPYTNLVPSGDLKVGFAGRLAKTTDLDMVNKILRRLPEGVEFHLAVVGDLSKLNIPSRYKSRIKISTNISNDNMSDFYKNIDVLFAPLMIEGISRVALESLACGRPIIMYKNGNRDPIIHGKTGFLIKRSLNELTDLLETLRKKKDELKLMGKSGNKLILKKFSNDIIIKRTRAIYNEILINKNNNYD